MTYMSKKAIYYTFEKRFLSVEHDQQQKNSNV